MRVKLEIALLRELRLADSQSSWRARDSNQKIIARTSVLNNRFTSHPPNLPQNDHNSSKIRFFATWIWNLTERYVKRSQDGKWTGPDVEFCSPFCTSLCWSTATFHLTHFARGALSKLICSGGACNIWNCCWFEACLFFEDAIKAWSRS